MRALKPLLSSAIAFSLTLISASLPLQAQTNPQSGSQNPRSGWYNCLTREVWTPQKTVWCNQIEQMMNGSFTTQETGKVTLQNGQYDNRDAQINLQLVNRPGLVATGDLNGNGQSDMVALLTANTGGSGIFVYLAAGIQQGDRLVTTTPVLLGDRVQVRSVQIRDGKVLVDLIEQGPNDPMCCPTVRVQKTFELGYGLLPLEER